MQATLRALLERRKTGVLSFALRGILLPLGMAYGLAGKLRAALYRRHWCGSHRSPLPVISVGNLTAGGTGKTPFVAMLARLLKSMGHTPAVLLRGYAHADPEKADEVLLYHQLAPGAKIIPGRNRVLNTFRARDAGADVILLDDGFQHLRLQRDLDIVLVDATCPFGGGLPLPAGMLREFPSALRRAGLLILTRADQVSPGRIEVIKEAIHARCGDIPTLSASHRPSRLADLNGDPLPLDMLAGQKVTAISGIGRPDAFAVTLRELGAEVCAALEFSDHHAYSSGEIEKRLQVFDDAWIPVTTEKDAMKLREVLSPEWRTRVLVVGVEMRVSGLPVLRERLERLLGTEPLKGE